MEFSEVVSASERLGSWAHIATVSPSGTPYVSPVHPCWDSQTLWTMVGAASTKATNLASNPKVTCHWQVSDQTNFDSLIVWGTGEVFTDLETKRRLWDGVFDYDLNAFAPGGPDDSPDTAFMALTPTKAVLLEQYGMAGRGEWRA
jgi:general stress protein 26